MHGDGDSDGGHSFGRRAALRAVGSGLLALGVGVGGTASAQDRFPPSARTNWGRPRRVGDGTMATFLTTDRVGAPRYLGVWFTADALDGLPESGAAADVTDLPLPRAVASATNVEWVTADWNPEGHHPVDAYDVPHFDFHFYLVGETELRRELPPGECDVDGDGTPDTSVPCEVFERGTLPLPPRQRPPGYVSSDEVAPYMGNHWVDQTAPEFDGGRFTRTWIYGTFDGRITFFEPMVSLDYLRGLRGREVVDVATPETFAAYGFYPTQYVVRYLANQDAYAVVLRRFQLFEGS